MYFKGELLPLLDMKLTTLFPIGMALCIGTITGQEMVPVSTPDSRWINNYTEHTWTAEGPKDKVIQSDAFCLTENDSIISKKNYFQLDDCNGNYLGSMRDEKGKVFFVPANQAKEHLVYDFNVQKGDTIKNVLYRTQEGRYASSNLIVQDVDSITIYGFERKRIHFAGAYWIEGIGNTKGLMAENWMEASNIQMELTCMSSMNVTYFPNTSAGYCELPKSIDQHKYTKVTELVYPKNANNWFNIVFDRRVDQDEIIVLSDQGKIIKPFISVNPDRIGVDLSKYPAGNYIIITRKDNYMSIGKMEKI